MNVIKFPVMRLFKRKNGTYYVEIRRGQAKSLKTNDKLLAQRLFKQIEKEALLGRLIQLERKSYISVVDFSKEYIAHREDNKAANTTRLDKECFDKLADFLGGATLLNTITRKQCEEFINHLRGNALKPTTINITIRHLKAAFKKAIEWEYIDKTPWEYVKQIKLKDSLPRACNKQEIESLLSVISIQEDRELILTYLYTAGRRTEIARLQWQDFKENHGIWMVHIKESKTKTRIIPLAENLKELLFYRKKHIGPVFPSSYYHPKEVSKKFRKYADNAGLKNVKLHDMRHTSATFMLLKGVPLKIVSEILGHTTVRTTEIYTKLIAEHLRDAINTLKF
jgi:site-specific recombinase XerD